MRTITLTEQEFDEAVTSATNVYISNISKDDDQGFVHLLKAELFPAPQWITDREPTEEDLDGDGYIAFPCPLESDGWCVIDLESIGNWPWMATADAKVYTADNPAPNPLKP